MTTLASDLVEETRSLLFSGQAEEANRLNGAVTSGATLMAFKYPLGTMLMKGAFVSIDLEDIRIWETSGTTATVVERGVNGTVAASHADLAYVAVLPKFTPFRILRAINEDLGALASPTNGLFQVKTLDLTYNASIQGYDMTSATSVIKLLELRYQVAGPSKLWPKINDFSLLRNMATTEFPSGFAIVVRESAYPGLPIRVRYASDFTALSALTTDVSTTGLQTTAFDLPPLGAVLRLMGPREMKRNFTETQYDPHRLEEIPPGAVAQSTVAIERLRHTRIEEEAARLSSDWPTTRR